MANLSTSIFSYVASKLALVVTCMVIPALMGALHLWAGWGWTALATNMSWPMTPYHLMGADVATTLVCSCILSWTPFNPQALRARATHKG